MSKEKDLGLKDFRFSGNLSLIVEISYTDYHYVNHSIYKH